MHHPHSARRGPCYTFHSDMFPSLHTPPRETHTHTHTQHTRTPSRCYWAAPALISSVEAEFPVPLLGCAGGGGHSNKETSGDDG